MDGLTYIDFLQVFFALASLVIGVITAFAELKTDNKLNRKGYLLLFFFVLSFAIAVVSTICKTKMEYDQRVEEFDDRSEKHIASIIDREEKYIDLIKKNNSILQQVNKTLDSTTKVLKKSETSIQKLSDLQIKSKELSDSLRNQLIIQRQINLMSTQILKNLIYNDSLKLKSAKIQLCNTLYQAMTKLNVFKLHLTKDDSYLKNDSIYNSIVDILFEVDKLFGEQVFNIYILNEEKLKSRWYTINKSLNFLVSQVTNYPGRKQNAELVKEDLNRIFINEILVIRDEYLDCY